MTAPWAAVPLPAGNPLPSGGMLMSHIASSASLTGLPRPGRSAAPAAPAAARSASTSVVAIPAAGDLTIDMLRLPLAVDRPAGDDVHVAHRECRNRQVDL